VGRCIFAELLVRRAIFPGRNEVDQLDLIFKLCGTPTDEVWPDYSKLPWYHLMHKNTKVYKRTVRDAFKSYLLFITNLSILVSPKRQ
jgi:cyclin-dependent kinase 12/13